MHTGRTTRIASAIVAGTGALWGLYWFPERRLVEIALPGAWGTLAIVTARLDPARVGLLLMAEVLVGAVSAALLAGERLGSWEIVGGALVVCAGVLEVGPVTGRRDRRSPS